MEICPKCKERMNATIYESGKEIGKYCANCDTEYYNKGDEE